MRRKNKKDPCFSRVFHLISGLLYFSHQGKRFLRRGLLGALFAAADTAADHIAVKVYLDHEFFIVIRALGRNQHIFHPFFRVLLDDLLQAGLVIDEGGLLVAQILLHKGQDELRRLLQPAIQIDGGDERLKRIGDH